MDPVHIGLSLNKMPTQLDIHREKIPVLSQESLTVQSEQRYTNFVAQLSQSRCHVPNFVSPGYQMIITSLRKTYNREASTGCRRHCPPYSEVEVVMCVGSPRRRCDPTSIKRSPLAHGRNSLFSERERLDNRLQERNWPLTTLHITDTGTTEIRC